MGSKPTAISASAVFFSTAILLGAAFGRVVTDTHCDEKSLAPVKGPIPYGPRKVMPPDHDLPADPVPQPVHKGVKLEVWHDSTERFEVGGMALLANGTMLELDYNGTLYHVTGLDSAQKVTRRALPTASYTEPLGLYLRNNREVYVATANSIWSYDFDGTNLTQEKELLKVPKRAGWYGWNGDFETDSAYLYVNLGVHGSIGRYNFKTGKWDLDYATSMRNSHGMGKDDSGNIWFSDNQGNYRPATPIFLLKPGKAYGVPTQNWTQGAAIWQTTLGPAADVEAFRSDMIWIPYDKMSHSATDIHFMKSGPFKGQALVGDNRTGHLNRIMPEKVGGQYQGAAIRMTGGLEAGNYRISEDGKGNFYLGGLGKAANRYWMWCEKLAGFQKLTFNADFIGNKAYNDVRSVSLVKDGLVVAFTSDISADFLLPANYRAYVFSYIKSVSAYYGGPKSDSAEIKIQGITKRSSREIFLNMTGLQPETVLGLEFGDKLTTGNNLQSYEMFYTLNSLSDRVPAELAAGGNAQVNGIDLRLGNGILSVRGLEGDASEISVRDLSGSLLRGLAFHSAPGGGMLDVSPLRGGVYFLSLKAGNRRMVKPFVIPVR